MRPEADQRLSRSCAVLYALIAVAVAVAVCDVIFKLEVTNVCLKVVNFGFGNWNGDCNGSSNWNGYGNGDCSGN